MAATFQKTMLRVGSYKSPDGEVVVTPERLKHWATQHRRLTQARQVVPMHWDHGSELDSLQPIAMSEYGNRKSRTAKNTIGRMTGFELMPDGQSAEVSFRVSDDTASKRFESNDIYVSPVVFPKWKDGAGNDYDDLITHLDAVNHPVDHSQSAARLVRRDSGTSRNQENNQYVACALRLSSSVKPLRLNMDHDMYQDMEKDAQKLGEDEGYEMQSSKNTTPPNSPSVAVSEMLMALSDHGIVLPDDTDEDCFMDRLKTALIATNSQKADDADDEPMLDGNTFDQTGDTMVVDPQIATMSSVERFADNQFRQNLSKQLDHLLESGRCSPVEHQQQTAALESVRLSLNDQGEPGETKVGSWIDSRSSLPRGAVWSPDEKLKRMSSQAADLPKDKVFGADPSNPTDAEAEAIAKEMLS